jgi:hypothetical protein
LAPGADIEVNMARAYRRLLLLVVVLGLASCSKQMPSQPQVGTPGPAPTGSSPSDSSLAANQARWSAAGIQSYRYRFRWGCFCVPDFTRVVDITVIHGAVVSVVDAATGIKLDDQSAARYRTIDGLFDFVRESMDYPADYINVAFNSSLGYPLAANVDYVAGLADDEMGFSVFALIPIHPWRTRLTTSQAAPRS